MKYLKEELEKTAQDVRIFGESNQVLLAGINTRLENCRPIVLAGHIDTVKANIDLYDTDPYVFTQIGDKAFGLGTIDMKSFTAVVLDKIKQLQNLDAPIVFALTTDEETNLKSTAFMIETMKKLNIKPKFTILGEPTNSGFLLSSNACYEYEVKFFGKACHSSQIEKGINSICACAKLVTFLEENQKRYRLTSNCGVISGGEVVNKVPDYASLTFDIRSLCPQDVENFFEDFNCFIAILKQTYVGLNIEVINTLEIPAFNMTDNEKIVGIANKLNIKTGQFSGGCEAGYYTRYSGDAVIFGVGDLGLAHKPNEFVVLSEYADYSAKLIDVLSVVIYEYCEVD